MSLPVETFTVRVGGAASFSVHNFGGELFAETSDAHNAFGFSTMSGFRGELSRQLITCVEKDELKQALLRTGLVRFIDGAGLSKLINARLEGANRVTALKDLAHARRGGAEAPPQLPPNAPVPAVVVAADRLPAIPRLELPRGDGWWNDDKFIVGKKVCVSTCHTEVLTRSSKFALADFDQGDVLKGQITGFRLFWTAKDSPRRDGDALAPATFDKKLSRGEFSVYCPCVSGLTLRSDALPRLPSARRCGPRRQDAHAECVFASRGCRPLSGVGPAHPQDAALGHGRERLSAHQVLVIFWPRPCVFF